MMDHASRAELGVVPGRRNHHPALYAKVSMRAFLISLAMEAGCCSRSLKMLSITCAQQKSAVNKKHGRNDAASPVLCATPQKR